MKFFTTDWYLKMQCANAFLGIKSNAKASEFSEEFYQKQYEKWIKEQLDYEKKVSGFSFEKLFPAPTKADLRFIPEDEVKKLKDEFAENLPEYKKMYAERPEYDENHLRTEYAAVAKDDQMRVLALLPDEIKSKIADTRLLGIGIVSPEVKKLITKFSKDSNKAVNDTLKQYDEYYSKLAEKLPTELTSEKLDMNGSSVLSYSYENGKVTLTFDTECSYSNVCEITFEGAKANGEDPSGACWLYDEVDVTDSGYTLGILFARPDGEVFTFECEFSKVETKIKLK